MFNKKAFRNIFILIICSFALSLSNSIFSYIKSAKNMDSISDKYSVFLKDAKDNPEKLVGKTIVFYRSSCLECRNEVPISYLLYNMSSYHSSNEWEYYNVDNKNNNYIKSIGVNYVPSAVHFYKDGNNIKFNFVKLYEKEHILNYIILCIINSIFISFILYAIAFIYCEIKFKNKI